MSRAFGWLNWERSLAVLMIAAASAGVPFEPAGAQQPLPLERFQYFNSQRAYPFDQIPAGALQRAREDYQRKWGSLPVPFFNQSLWTQIGPGPITNVGFDNRDGGMFDITGRINSIAVHPTNPNTIYIGAAAGGVWRSDDGGMTWNALTDTQCGLAMGSIAIDPRNPNIVYAGTGEANGSEDAYLGCGVLRSTDGGITWTQSGGGPGGVFNQRGIYKVVIDPTTAGSTTSTKVFVASTFGLYVSLDSGATWNSALLGSATDVVIDESNTNNVYVAMDGRLLNPGVWKSTTGGGFGSFNPIMNGLPSANFGRVALAIARNSPSTLYASFANADPSTLLGMFRTTNGGGMWTPFNATNASCSGQCFYNMYLAVDPTIANVVYFGGFSLYRSIDGADFIDIGRGQIHVDQHAFAFQPGLPSTYYAGNDGGIYKSTSGAWTSLNTNSQDFVINKLAISQFYPGFALAPNFRAMGGTQDNGIALYQGQIGWPGIPPYGDGGYGAIDFNNPETAYNAGFRFPSRTDNLSQFPPPPNAAWNPKSNGIATTDRKRFIAPLIMSPSD